MSRSSQPINGKASGAELRTEASNELKMIGANCHGLFLFGAPWLELCAALNRFFSYGLRVRGPPG